MRCLSCGHEVVEGARFCGHCGASLAPKEAKGAGRRLWKLVGLLGVLVVLGADGACVYYHIRIQEALQAAREIEDAFFRSWALREIAQALAQAGRKEEALQAARGIEKAFFRSWALKEVAIAMAQAGRTEEALKVAREIEDADDRSRALKEVAIAMVKAALEQPTARK